jgi:hypothetical protein
MGTQFHFVDGVLRPVGDKTVSHDTSVPLAVVCTPTEWEGVHHHPCPEDLGMNDALSRLFGTYEVPIGLIRKLRILRGYLIYFILDDSSSMGTETEIKAFNSDFMKKTKPRPSH